MTTAAETYATCKHCGTYHGARCPFVKAIEYYETGAVKRVEFIDPPPTVTLTPAVTWTTPPLSYPPSYFQTHPNPSQFIWNNPNLIATD